MRILKKILRWVRLYVSCRDKKVWAVNVAKWKRDHFEKFIVEKDILYIPMNISWPALKKMARLSGVEKVYIWGCQEPESVKRLLTEFEIDLIRVEDGFVRSIGLGAEHTPPLSLCFDRRGIYFDATRESDLEWLLNNHEFEKNSSEMKEARKLIDQIVECDITKYNEKNTNMAKVLYGVKEKDRILVIGQVEDDQSIQYGCNKSLTNNDLVRLAAKENPDAQIVYKIHPDVLVGKREGLSDPSEVSHLCSIISDRMCLSDALSGVDRVYTITSLLGFEALLRGIPVTTLGCPFYSGWGITDDRQDNERRKVKKSLEEVFYAAYVLYPVYCINGVCGIDEVIELIKERMRNERF